MTPLEELRLRIIAANDAYYNKGASIVTDNQYDQMLNMLRRADCNDALLRGVGSIPTLDKIAHEYPMGSLDNIDANKPADLALYIKRNKDAIGGKSRYHITPKIDGSSIALTYENGKLTKAITRGNGEVGQDITAKALYFKLVPADISIPSKVTVRGEAVMHRSDFLEYIKTAKLEGVRNPRNTGNGIVVRKDSFGAGLIHFYAFNAFIEDRVLMPGYVSTLYNMLTEIGFTPPPFVLVGEDELKSTIDTMFSGSYQYDIDGLVVRVDDFEQQYIINEGGDVLRPRSDQAIKFNSKKAETTITGVTVTVGSTGKITPTLTVEPVEIGGIVNSNVLVYNYNEIERLKIGVGDVIQVVLAGDIIPKCLNIVDKRSTETIKRPLGCPVCGCALSHKDLIKGESVDLYCTNSLCAGIQFEKIKNFIGSSKRGMGILGIGDGLIENLIKSDLIKTIPDLYNLTEGQLSILSMGNGVVGEKRAHSIITNITESKNVSIQKLIGSLGVDGMGEHRAEIMMEVAGNLNTFNDWIDAVDRRDYIISLKHQHLPLNILHSINEQLYEMKDILLKLREMGVGVHEPSVETEDVDDSPKPFEGISFCFTGTRQYSDVVEKLGGKIVDSVSKTTNFLVQKDASKETSKSKKAASVGTKVLGLPELEKMIKETGMDI